MFFLNYIFFFNILIIISGIMVLNTPNPVQSILFLILCFIFSSFLFIILGAEFLGILLLIVYVGAISILFLFVVMMLNIRLLEIYIDFFRYLPIGSFICLFFLLNLFVGLFSDFGFFIVNLVTVWDFFYLWPNFLYYKNNIFYLGVVLYNFYIIFVILASFILLSAMFGVIILTVDFEYRFFFKKSFFIRSFQRLSQGFSFWSFWYVRA